MYQTALQKERSLFHMMKVQASNLLELLNLSNYQTMNLLQHEPPLVAITLKSMGHIHAPYAENAKGLEGLRGTSKPMLGITLVWRNKGKSA